MIGSWIPPITIVGTGDSANLSAKPLCAHIRNVSRNENSGALDRTKTVVLDILREGIPGELALEAMAAVTRRDALYPVVGKFGGQGHR